MNTRETNYQREISGTEKTPITLWYLITNIFISFFFSLICVVVLMLQDTYKMIGYKSLNLMILFSLSMYVLFV